MQWYGLLTSLHLSPCHSLLFTASTSSTSQTRRPSPRRTHTPWHPTARLALRRPRRARNSPLQHPWSPEAPPPGRGSPCAYQVYPAHRRYPIPSLPARVGLQTVRATLHLCLMPADPRYSYSPLSASFSPQSFPSHYVAVSLACCRRSPAQQGTLHCTHRATRSSLRSRMPPSHHASWCSKNHH